MQEVFEKIFEKLLNFFFQGVRHTAHKADGIYINENSVSLVQENDAYPNGEKGKSPSCVQGGLLSKIHFLSKNINFFTKRA